MASREDPPPPHTLKLAPAGMGGSDPLSNIPTFFSSSGPDARLNQVQIAPIGARASGDTGGGGGGMSAIQQAIFRGLSPPKFSGNEEDWGVFTKDFKEYAKVLGQQKQPTDGEMLMLFSMSLPPHLKREVEFLGNERGDAITFTEIMQHFNALFTRNRATALRRKLRELALPKSGKITPQILRNFEIDFRECVRELPQLSRDELGESLRSKLLEYMSAWIIEREKEADRCTPTLHLRFPIHTYSLAQVKEAVQALSGAEIKEISALEIGFLKSIAITSVTRKKSEI